MPKFVKQRRDPAMRGAQALTNTRLQLAQLRYVPRALGIVWSAAPRWTAASFLLLLIQGLLPVATVFLTGALVNALVIVVDDGGEAAALLPAATYALLLGVVLLATQVLTLAAGYVRATLAEQVQDCMNRLIHTKAVNLDLEFYESPTYFDQLQRASVDAIDRPLGLLDSLSSLLQTLITLVAMAGILLTFSWWMPLVLLVGALPALWVMLQTTWAYHHWRLRNTVNQRRLAYYHYTLLSDQPAAEVRLFGLGQLFSDGYDRLRGQLRGERLALLRHQTVKQIGASLLALLTVGLALVWVVWQALAGRFNLGDLAMFAQALYQGQLVMQRLLASAGEIYRNLAFLEDLFTFLELEPRVHDPASPAPTPPLVEGIRLDAVTFRYPDSPSLALQGFSLEIPAGQIVAIVGENGAGKSTLLKLLCRFYDPHEGCITWDGVDLRQMAQTALRRRITVLFQQPHPFHHSLADNIRFGDLPGMPTPAAIEAAARAGGAASIAEKLPEGYATMLGKWFGCTELSVGEWQRVALARAFVRQADLLILDEPTSAMDSWAENEWMGRFRTLVAGRTALIITHRFTTAMQADIIHVVDNGKVIESGTHAELVDLGGRYARSWQQQMRDAERRGGR